MTKQPLGAISAFSAVALTIDIPSSAAARSQAPTEPSRLPHLVAGSHRCCDDKQKFLDVRDHVHAPGSLHRPHVCGHKSAACLSAHAPSNLASEHLLAGSGSWCFWQPRNLQRPFLCRGRLTSMFRRLSSHQMRLLQRAPRHHFYQHRLPMQAAVVVHHTHHTSSGTPWIDPIGHTTLRERKY